MSANLAGGEVPARDPHLPPLARIGNLIVPRAPQELSTLGLEDDALNDLALRYANTVPRFTTDTASQRLHLSMALTGELLEKMAMDGVIEETMRSGPGRAHYRITAEGREHASRALESCGYIGPAPVSLEAYAAMLRYQFASTPQVKPEDVSAALSSLVLSPEAVQLAGLAVSSGRSMFVFGPPGNGKSSLGRQIHAALPGDYWIPYAISVAGTVIRVFDDQSHQRIDLGADKAALYDQRWIRIRRPMVIVGGELTLELLDLVYSPALRCYEAPPHLKANGGVFLVDDFGRERVSPDQLLNRFITPMEQHIDYFMLRTGQKIQLPLRHVLIVATNLSPEVVTDPAFLRRMGYRLYLGAPTPEQYAQIFQQYAQKRGVSVVAGLIDEVLKRYHAQDRELRACEPRDLIERARDICRYQGKPMELTAAVLDLAWIGYFGNA